MSQSNRIHPAQLFVQESEGVYRTAKPEEVVGAALRITERRFRKGVSLTTPSVAREYLALRLAALEHEVFGVLFLDAQSQLIEYQELFRGTATQTSVYPREVVKAALATNAVGAILVHNHPSGSPDPSRADEYLTQTLKTALALVDVRLLDHLIIAGAGVASFAERGLI